MLPPNVICISGFWAIISANMLDVVLVALVVAAIIVLVATWLRKETVSLITAIILLLVAIFGAVETLSDPKTERNNRADDISGKWTMHCDYNISVVLGPDSSGNTVIRDKAVEMGTGEMYLWMNPKTSSFQGMGWVNIGTTEKDPTKALLDTSDNDMVTFVTSTAAREAGDPDSFSFQTQSVHKTIRRSAMNSVVKTRCNSSFPADVDPLGWHGRGTCMVDSFQVEVFITLTKRD